MTDDAPEYGSEPEQVRHLMALLAPGTPIRDGLERILHGRTGALIVLGDSPEVRRVSTGGFAIDVRLTPQALRELSKMDGGLILSSDHERIMAAGVHFVPDRQLRSEETGTRHRSADRVSQQTGIPAVVASASMNTLSVFLRGRRYRIEEPEKLLTRANQALDTLGSYRSRLVDQTSALTMVEVHDVTTVADVAAVAQRIEMARRLDSEVRAYVSALGVEGRLIQLQRDELIDGVEELSRLLVEDYRPDDVSPGEFTLAPLSALGWDDLGRPTRVAAAIGLDPARHPLSMVLHARGYRQLSTIADLPPRTVQAIVDRFGTLQSLYATGISDLGDVQGVGAQRAKSIRAALERIFEGEEQAGNLR
ncbi:DNA integrity scanning diadenylate cyclase DisA [Acidipropionibacterium virtanenii]|uniref:DNA integrity scanning protein DisA n=1 Tax=Acidipropionibacterium virtanenii TaxID=2057246 RepID=A0A344URJ7_9ACTN|nr:DNA integrity scanning diadenylate cyclase DisA [Acidipropionibacterium virtanenii]AXE37895.1 DNA integrity scanning protein DisA [Acidipropionibacterium virtanenii]